MNTEFNIKNFRAFNEDGVIFNLAPITILTGCNSAGKSSVVKSLLLLDNFFRQMKRDIRLTGDCNPVKYRLGVANHAFRLGNFASVLNRDAKSHTISFAYKIKPLIATEPFNVTYTFIDEETDTLNDGWLHSIEISNKNQDVVCKIIVENGKLIINQCNWTLLKDSFSQFGYYSIISILMEQKIILLNFPGRSSYSSQEIQDIESELHDIKESGWTNQITTENIRDFNDVYINTKNKLEIFNSADVVKIIEFIKGGNLLHSLPIIDVVKNISKSDVRTTLMQNKDAWCTNIAADMDAIVSDFEKSEFDTFADYLKDKEDRYGLCQVGRNFILSNKNTLINQLDGALSYRYQLMIDRLDIDDFIEFSLDGKPVAPSLSREEAEKKKQQRREELSFKFIIITLWKYSMELDADLKKYSLDIEKINGCEHPLVQVFAKYAHALLLELIVPDNVFDNFTYVGSTKAEALRLYRVDAYNMDSFEKTINDYLESKRNYKGKYVPDTFLNTWIRNFNVGYSISIKNTVDGLGIVVLLHTFEKDTIGHPLADEGYGITQLLSILLNIETAILNSEERKRIPLDRDVYKKYSADELRETQYSQSTLAIEEPEIHLHPKYQSLLMDMFNEAYQNYNVHFIIETHSEYLVRRSQVLVAEAKYKDEQELAQKCPYKVYYIPQPSDGKPYDMVYKTNGKFQNRFGKGFFDVADSLMLDLI